jgi:two-component system invasion response regulator UvrY
MIRVLIADDHAVVREGIAQILSRADDIQVGGEAASGGDVLKAVQERPFDVLILDLSMPGGGGLEILPRVLLLRPGLRILVLSMHSARQYVLRALKSGAAGYMTKESAPDELISAVRRVASGGKYLSPAVSESVVDGLIGGAARPLHELLSDREYQVLRMIAQGKTATRMASELSLSVKTISTYRARILEKLGLKTTAELIRYALDERLTD